MLFNEVYGNYYNTVAAILDEAIDNSISSEKIRKIVEEKAFAESIVTIPEQLSDGGEWPLLDNTGMAVIKHETYMPPTTLEKRWLKTLLLDPRIELFNPDKKGLEDVEPLFHPEDIVFFDQFSDGDPYQDEKYIEIFRLILSALKNRRTLRILYPLKNGSEKWMTCNPIRLEYSLRDDKFRLISASKSRVNTIILSKIIDAKREHREPVIIPHFSCHVLRHTFCSRLCESDMNVKVIQEIMGHKNVETTLDIYTEVNFNKKQESLEELAKKIDFF